jgi:hypothetical protein
MTPPCPVDVGAVVLAPGGRGRVVAVHGLSRTVLVELGEDVERFGGYCSPMAPEGAPSATLARGPTRRALPSAARLSRVCP